MTRTYGTTCVPCRRLKIKCIASSTDPTRCARCVKVGRPCVAEPRRRRATKHGEQSSAEGSNYGVQQQDPARQVRPTTDVNDVKSLFANYDLSNETGQSGVANTGVASARNSSSASPLDDSQEATRSDDSAGFTPPAFVSHSEDARILSLDAALDPRSLGGKSGSDRADSSRESTDAVNQSDPIHLKLLNRPSAQHLYEGYFTHFEYSVGFLDPVLYTFDYTRQRSSFLFTILLSISARVFRPDLARILRNHAETLLGKTLLSCDADVENIWAIVCMYYWKELGDKRGYTLIGFAMRLASASGWHGGRRSANTGHDDTATQNKAKLTEIEVRKLRDQDRAWLYLGSLDRTLSFFTDRPLASITVAPDLGSRSWLKTSDYWTYSFGDARAMAGHELTEIAKPVHDYICSTRRLGMSQISAPDDVSDLSNAIHLFNNDLISWSEHWAPIFASHETAVKVLESQVYLYGNQIGTYFNSVLLHRVLDSTGNCVTTPKAIDAITSCYSTALAVLREVVVLGRMEVLYYLWDTAHLMIAYAAMVLLKLLKQAPSCPGISVQEAYGVLKDAADVHESTATSLSSESNGSTATTVEAQARLLKAILFRMRADILPSITRHESQLGTLIGSDQNNDGLPPLLCHPSEYPFSFPLEQQFGGDEKMLEENSSLNTESQWNESQEMAQLTDEMDLTLDGSFIENWFTQAGLLPWDEPGIFKDPR